LSSPRYVICNDRFGARSVHTDMKRNRFFRYVMSIAFCGGLPARAVSLSCDVHHHASPACPLQPHHGISFEPQEVGGSCPCRWGPSNFVETPSRGAFPFLPITLDSSSSLTVALGHLGHRSDAGFKIWNSSVSASLDLVLAYKMSSWRRGLRPCRSRILLSLPDRWFKMHLVAFDIP